MKIENFEIIYKFNLSLLGHSLNFNTESLSCDFIDYNTEKLCQR